MRRAWRTVVARPLEEPSMSCSGVRYLGRGMNRRGKLWGWERVELSRGGLGIEHTNHGEEVFPTQCSVREADCWGLLRY